LVYGKSGNITFPDSEVPFYDYQTHASAQIWADTWVRPYEWSVFRSGMNANSYHRFWQAGGGYDRNIWSMEKAVEKAHYCHRNPVTRGLVEDPALWRWSSYRSLEMAVTEDEPLELDDWGGGLNW